METAPKYQTRQDFETSRTILDDPRLSYRAIGIALYLISKSDDEIVTLDDLTSAHSEGKVAARNALRELADAGYLKRERVYETGRKALRQSLTWRKSQFITTLERQKQDFMDTVQAIMDARRGHDGYSTWQGRGRLHGIA